MTAWRSVPGRPWHQHFRTPPGRTLIIGCRDGAFRDPSDPKRNFTRADLADSLGCVDGVAVHVVATADRRAADDTPTQESLTALHPLRRRGSGLRLRADEVSSFSSVTRREIGERTATDPLSAADMLSVTSGLADVDELSDPAAVAPLAELILARRLMEEQLVISSLPEVVAAARAKGLRTGLVLGRPMSPGLIRRDLSPQAELDSCQALFAVITPWLHWLGTLDRCEQPGVVWGAWSDSALTRALLDPKVAAIITDRRKRAWHLRQSLDASHAAGPGSADDLGTLDGES